MALGPRGRRSDGGYEEQVSVRSDVAHLAKGVHLKCFEYVQYD
jgi:hypothetical protein